MYSAKQEINMLIQNAINKISIIFDQVSVSSEEETIKIDNFDSLLHDIDELIHILEKQRNVNSIAIAKLIDLIVNEVDGSIEEKHLMSRKHTIDFLLKLFFKKESIRDEDKRINSLINLCNKITEFTHEEYSKKEALYYKNILTVEEYKNFEEMTDLLKDELTSFDINLFYCEKILDFINKELTQQQVLFSMQFYMIQQFINNSFFVMILTSTKLFSTAKTNKNFGFDYFKNYINQSCDKNDEKIIQSLREICGGEVRNLIKEGKELCKELESIRNYYVAHYDILKIEEISKIKLDLKLFVEIFDVAVRIFETLSLKRFHRRDIAYTNLIKRQGFKRIVCQNYYVRGKALSDIDSYLNHLRKNYLIPKDKQL